jgi:hypothetical protein
MARTAVSRTIAFHPATGITRFLGTAYTTHGVAEGPLASLLPIYPTPSPQVLSQLQRKMSSRTQRAGAQAVADDAPAFKVLMFKKIKSKNLPNGLSSSSFVEFFTDQFSFQTQEARNDFQESTASLIASPHYSILAITIPVVSVDDPTKLIHYIVGACLLMYDNKQGSYVACIGVAEKGDASRCTLSETFFTDPSNSNTLSDVATFRGRGMASFLLSTIQVLGFLGYIAPTLTHSDHYNLPCDENADANHCTHHVYLQARIEMGSAYVMYVKMGFSTLAVSNGHYHCTSYCDQCPVNRHKKR